MKILRLRFQNLNSLRGASEIDFESGPLGQAGLFAITGPTGAGKSTLLDAMTLALYGKAARYGSQPSPETMMSRHTGDCFAEVEFSCAGGRFRSSWHLQRAHRKPGGKVQSPKRRVIALPAETVLTEKNEESGRLIEQLTGLDYERFLRSVMLAQGDFAAFLKAKPDDRANLLEQVTGTALYRDISVECFQRFSRAKAAHELLLGQTANIQVLDTEERGRRLTELARLREELGERRKATGLLQARLQAAQRWLDLEQAELRRQEAQSVLDADLKAREPELARLALGEKARSLAPALTGLDREEAQVKKLGADIETTTRELPVLTAALATAETALAQASEALAREAVSQEELQALWLKVQKLDTQLEACRLGLAPLERALVENDRDQAACKASLETQTTELAEIAGVLSRGAEWLSANEGDARLADLDGPTREASQVWADASRRVLESSRRIQSLETDRARQGRVLEEAARVHRTAIENLVAPRAAAERAKIALDTLLPAGGLPGLEAAAAQSRRRREHAASLLEQARRHQKDLAQVSESSREASELAGLLRDLDSSLEGALAKKALLGAVQEASHRALVFAERCAALVKERPLLQDGRECPLCGATHHPWAHRPAAEAAELVAAQVAEEKAAGELRLQEQLIVELRTRKAAALERSKQSERIRTKAEAEERGSRAELVRLQSLLGLPEEIRELASCETLASETLAEEQLSEHRLLDARRAVTVEAEALAELRRLEALQVAASTALEGQVALFKQVSEQAETASKSQADACAEEKQARQAALLLVALLDLPSEADQAAYASFLEKLQQRARVFVKAQQKVQDQSQKQLVLKQSSEALSLQLEKAATARTELQDRLEQERALETKLRQERNALFGERSIETSRLEARTRLTSITKVHTESGEAERSARSRLQACEREQERLQTESAQAAEQFRKQGDALTEAAALLGFAELATLRSALLRTEDFDALTALQRSLSARQAGLAAEKSRLEQERLLMPAEARTDAPLADELRASIAAQETACGELSRSIGAQEECIRMDDTHRARLGALLLETEAAHREYARWDALRALIGSADGSLFARFAQGLTLDRLAWLANRHLIQLNPRYSVRRSRGAEARDLELEIMDHYQADVARPMGSLSGGESFLVSLALALALSELASGRSAIESLFIDEGFGSLDSDTLEAAMAALEGLQARGKTIGVISHVTVMQERIATQIRVIKEAGGCSRISVVG